MKKFVVNQEKKLIKETELEKEDVSAFIKEGKHFVTKNAKRFHVEFASSLDEENMMTLSKDQHLLKMNFLRKTLTKGKSLLGKTKKNQVIYEEVEDGLDLSYLLQESKIKESIIIKTKQESYDYDFTLDIGELTPKFNEKENVLELTKDGQSIYRILSPYMEDSNHQRSDDCAYEIEEKENSLVLHLHCDKTWINDEKRVFPVIVDPTIEVVSDQVMKIYQITLNNIKEATTICNVESGYNNSRPFCLQRVKIVIDCNELKKATTKKIQKATMVLKVNSKKGNGTLRVTQDSKIIQNIRISDIAEVLKYDITNLLDQAEIVYEMQLDLPSNVVIQDDYNSNIMFYTTQIANEENKSRIELLCISEKELETNDYTKKYQLPRSGSTEVNYYNGYIQHFHNDASINNQSLNLQLMHLFDSREYEDNFFTLSDSFLGKGWKTNFHQRIIKNKDYYQLSGNKDIVYLDAQNKKHELKTKWYYYNSNKEKIEISKEKIYLDIDQQIKYQDTDGNIFLVKYEVSNDEGLNYVSGNDISFFNEFSQYHYHFEIDTITDGKLENLQVNGNGEVSIPIFYEIRDEQELHIPYSRINFSSMTSDLGNPVVKSDKYRFLEVKHDEQGFYCEYQIAESKYKQYLQIIYEYEEIREEDIYKNEDLLNVNENLKSAIEYYDDLYNNYLGLLLTKYQLAYEKSNRTLVSNINNYQQDISQERGRIDSIREYYRQQLVDRLCSQELIDLQRYENFAFFDDNFQQFYELSESDQQWRADDYSRRQKYLKAYDLAMKKLELDIEGKVQEICQKEDYINLIQEKK